MTESQHQPTDDDSSQDPSQPVEGAAIAFEKAPVPDHQDAVTVTPPDGHHLEENPAQ